MQETTSRRKVAIRKWMSRVEWRKILLCTEVKISRKNENLRAVWRPYRPIIHLVKVHPKRMVNKQCWLLMQHTKSTWLFSHFNMPQRGAQQKHESFSRIKWRETYAPLNIPKAGKKVHPVFVPKRLKKIKLVPQFAVWKNSSREFWIARSLPKIEESNKVRFRRKDIPKQWNSKGGTTYTSIEGERK